MQIANRLGWHPDQFWSVTPRELLAAWDGERYRMVQQRLMHADVSATIMNIVRRKGTKAITGAQLLGIDNDRIDADDFGSIAEFKKEMTRRKLALEAKAEAK